MQHVYTLNDLKAAQLDKLPRPPRLAVIGNPIAHSFSPQMQQAALDAMKEELLYIRVEAGLRKGDFERCVRRMNSLGFIGANVTVPFKKQAFAMATFADELARVSGAANTLRFTEEGIEAYNTDGPGFALAIGELCGCPLNFHRPLILGACGGAGSALAAQCVLSGCPQISLANRPKPELNLLAEKLREHAGKDTQLRTVSMADSGAIAAAVAEADLIVNATSLGLKEGDALPLNPDWLRPGQMVYDIVPHDTPLRRAASERGCLASDGLGMLLWQGAYAYLLWFGMEPPADIMREALRAAVAGA